METKYNIPSEVLDLKPKLIEIRRHIHQNPELGHEEFQTSAYIAKFLEELGLEVHKEVGKTGVVGVLRGSATGPTILLRADMDALPLTETTGLSFQSKNPGVHHACGHDGHVAILMIAAKVITEKFKGKLKGNVKFVFQPAEENFGGALYMIEDPKYPVLDSEPKVDECFGLHLLSIEEVGSVQLSKGCFSAYCAGFDVTVKGKGGHGSAPHLSNDPIFVACQLIENFYAITSRNMNPCNKAVLNVGMIKGGAANNVIPNECEFKGTFRCFEETDKQIFLKRMNEIAKGFEAAFNVEIKIDYSLGYKGIFNNAGSTEKLVECCENVVGKGKIGDLKFGLYAEDFSEFIQNVPGAFLIVGAACENPIKENNLKIHHDSNFDFNEEALAIGVSIWVKLIENNLVLFIKNIFKSKFDFE